MGVDRPGPSDDGDGPEEPDDPEETGGPRWWDRSAGELAFAVEAQQPFGSRAALRAEAVVAAENAAIRRRESQADRGADGTSDRTSDRTPDRMAERIETLRDIITDEHGNYIGVEGRRKDVRVIPKEQMDAVVYELYQQFGEPDQVSEDASGTKQMWWISKTAPRANVTFRSYSDSGGAALDLNHVPGFEDLKRFHIPDDE